jgi:3-hydroxyisobutyrate dehydrogenase-like beta-hydroxyacid dehydrogenase
LEKKEKIGFIGLGKMGLPMANRLIDNGYSLVVHDVLKERTSTLTAKGAVSKNSAKDVCSQSDLIVTSLPDDSVLNSVALGPGGILEGVVKGKVFLDMSTVSPEISSRVAKAAEEKGLQFLRATVVGSPKYAEGGTLTIFLSGLEELYSRCLPILNILGQKLFYVGSSEEARYLKLVINLIIGTTAMIVGEALVFGERGGLDWNKMLDAIGNSVVASPVVLYKLQPLRDRDFSPTFSISQMAKDFDIALSTGRARGIPLPVASIVAQFMGMMKATGRGEMDLWALVTLMEELTGVKKS